MGPLELVFGSKLQCLNCRVLAAVGAACNACTLQRRRLTKPYTRLQRKSYGYYGVRKSAELFLRSFGQKYQLV